MSVDQKQEYMFTVNVIYKEIDKEDI